MNRFAPSGPSHCLVLVLVVTTTFPLLLLTLVELLVESMIGVIELVEPTFMSNSFTAIVPQLLDDAEDDDDDDDDDEEDEADETDEVDDDVKLFGIEVELLWIGF